MRTAPAVSALLICLALSACRDDVKPDAPVVPELVRVTVDRIVSVPAELSADCSNDSVREQTYAEAKRLALVRDEYLNECTQRMRKIRALANP